MRQHLEHGRTGRGVSRWSAVVLCVLASFTAFVAHAQHHLTTAHPVPHKPTSKRAPSSHTAPKSSSQRTSRTAPKGSAHGKPARGKATTAKGKAQTRSRAGRRSAGVTVPVPAYNREAITARAMQALSDPSFGIEGAKYLAPFFASLKALEAAPGSAVVRIQHWGDSHTAADLFTGDMRTLFQDRFGNAGAGFSLAGYPFKGYRIHGTRRSMSGGWTVLGTHLTDIGDGLVGMGGISIQTRRPGEWVTLDADAATVQVQYLIQPGGGEIAIYDNDTVLKIVSTDGPEFAGGVFTAQVPPGPHHLEVRTQLAAPIRLLGFTTENAGGVTYEAMGINGAEASLFLRWKEAIVQPLMASRKPSLIVLDYGTNEASDSNWTQESYAEMFTRILDRCHRLAPDVPVLVIGPPDRGIRAGRRGGFTPFAGVDRIIAAQRAVCRVQHCAFWDWRKHMGGFGAMRDWAAIGWAQPDHTHLTGLGYTELAGSFFSDIVHEYAASKTPADDATGSAP